MRVTGRTLLRAAALSMLASVIAACAVQEFETADSAPSVANSCERDVDCASESTSGTCGPGICVAASGDIVAAFLEVVPPAVAYYGAGDSFLIPLEDLDHGNVNEQVELPAYAEITGKLTAPASLLGDPPSESCEQAYDTASQTLRVHVELSRSDAVRGLPSLVLAANAESGNDGWTFSEDVPAGRYDVYATVLSGCDADFPPVFAPGQVFEPGVVKLEMHVGAVSKLSGIVTPPEKAGNPEQHVSLAGWQVSLVEPDQGRLISTTRKLNDSNPTNFELRYQPLTNATPLLRLTPPEDQVAPEVIWDLSALDLDGDGEVTPNLRALDLTTVNVRALIVDRDVDPVEGATVRLRSTKLLGASQGLNARFETVVESDEEGAISLAMLPGSYQVVVTPPDQTELAITEATWEIARTPPDQAGRTVEVPPREPVRGSVVDPVAGRPLRGVTVSVQPSTSAALDFLDRSLSPVSVTPRVASGFTDDLGAFSVAVDPGRIDLSVKPAAASNYPWLVMARVDVPSPALGEMPVTFPVPLGGTLRDPDGFPVQQALMRVFAVLDADEPTGLARTNDPLTGDGVLQVAEGRTDENGDFVLLLPSKLFGR